MPVSVLGSQRKGETARHIQVPEKKVKKEQIRVKRSKNISTFWPIITLLSAQPGLDMSKGACGVVLQERRVIWVGLLPTKTHKKTNWLIPL